MLILSEKRKKTKAKHAWLTSERSYLDRTIKFKKNNKNGARV